LKSIAADLRFGRTQGGVTMSHYERRIEQDLDSISQQVKAAAEEVEQALDDAVRALLTQDRDLANATILGDLKINREIRDIDHRCLSFVARHLPSAGHLRYVSAVRRLIIELERVGDYAVAMCRASVQLSEPPPGALMRDVEMMADHSRQTLGEAIKAFNAGNADQARAVRNLTTQMQSTFRRSLADLALVGTEGSRSTWDILSLATILGRLERVNDQAKNICEETIFAVTGETKPPKVYRVLFIDEKDNCLTKMAEAIARHDFPGSGRYASAGWSPTDQMDTGCRSVLDREGLDLDTYEPVRLQPVRDVLDDYHVIVGVGVDAHPQIPELPFRTVLLRWELPPVEDASAALPILRAKVRELMVTLRGEDAP
jgi:phosphate transport system protein